MDVFTDQNVLSDLALIDHVDRLSALYQLTDRLYRARSLDEIYVAALDALTAALGCRRASVLLFNKDGIMDYVAWRGLSQGCREAIRGYTLWQPGDRDPDPIFVADIEKIDEADWVKQAVLGEGIRALGFIPIVAGGGVIGKFMVCYGPARDFDVRDKELGVTIARQVGFSLERVRADMARQEAKAELHESEERFRVMWEHAPIMMWTSDAAGRCLNLNRMLREFWGAGDDLSSFDWTATMHPGDAPEIGRQMMQALARQSPVTIKGRYLNVEGEYRLLQTDARPRRSWNGEFLGMIGVNVDITEREQAERALRESEQRFRLAVEASPNGMLMADRYGTIVLANAEAEALFGYAAGELTGCKIEALVPERLRDLHPRHRADYNRQPSARHMGVGRDLFALRKDGTEIPVEIGLSPIDSPEGPMTLAAIVDISARKKADNQRDLLLAELNHRVKNTLAVVQGIAQQTFGKGAATPHAREAFIGRILALSAAHNLLTETHWESASIGDLVTDALQLKIENAGRVVLSGPRVELGPKAALSIGLAMHELHTNAVKYGALSNDRGRINIQWARQADRLRITWRECDGPPVSPPTHRGFGSMLLERALADDLSGMVETAFKPEGLACIIDLPLVQIPERG